MASLNQRFGSALRSNGRSLFANTAIEWPDFSLAQDLQYQTEDAVLSEIYDTDPLRYSLRNHNRHSEKKTLLDYR
jgi:hypothetical protein